MATSLAVKRMVSLGLLITQICLTPALPARGATCKEDIQRSAGSAGSTEVLPGDVNSPEPQPTSSQQPQQTPNPQPPKQQKMSSRTKKILIFGAILGGLLAIGIYSASQTR